MSGAKARIVFVAGLSGSGKSTAMAALEDLSFYCVDGLPPMLIEQFLDLCAKATPPIQKMALAIDTRESAFLRGMPEVVDQLRRSGAHVDLMFLECSKDALINRYRETRRVHPLSPEGSVDAGIEAERALLGDMAQRADVVIETSNLNVHELREAVIRCIVGQTRQTVINLISFGFRFGTPPAAELLFDVRFLPNPHFEPALRSLTGEHPEVAEFVLKNPRTKAFRGRLQALLDYLLPLYDEEGKAYLTIGIGCTGGHHRSVAIVEGLAAELRSSGREINVSHRDVERGA